MKRFLSVGYFRRNLVPAVALLGLFSALLLMTASCKREKNKNINIEQAGHPVASRILAPGMGTVGLIQEGKVYVYFLNEQYRWVLDKLSQFNIPEKNEGLLAMGIGTIGVVEGREIHFFSLDAYNTWVSDERFRFTLPRSYDRILSVKMPWELGFIALEINGFVEFFYFDESGNWVHDETAVFAIPEGIKHYFSLGNMTMAVVDDHRLGVYSLNQEGGWEFLDDYVLRLPGGYDAIIPWEPGIMAVLIDESLEFFELDLDEGRWVMDEAMRFVLPF
jgi:hypothetical protein